MQVEPTCFIKQETKSLDLDLLCLELSHRGWSQKHELIKERLLLYCVKKIILMIIAVVFPSLQNN